MAGFGQITPSYIQYASNGLTKSGNRVILGGALTANTVVSYIPSARYLAFGDFASSTAFGFGNLTGGSTVIFTVANANILSLTSAKDVDSVISQYSSDVTSNRNALEVELEKTGAYGFSHGLYNYNNANTGFQDRISELSYRRKGANSTDTSVMSIVVSYNYADHDSSNIHAVMYTDTSGVDTFNGWHINKDYAQLEYNKTAEDGQASGKSVTINDDGVSIYINGTKIFRIPNAVTDYASDAAAVIAGLTTGDVYRNTLLGVTSLCIIP